MLNSVSFMGNSSYQKPNKVGVFSLANFNGDQKTDLTLKADSVELNNSKFKTKNIIQNNHKDFENISIDPGLEDAYAKQAKACREAHAEPDDHKLWARLMLEEFNLINMLLRKNPDDETLLVNRALIVDNIQRHTMSFEQFSRNESMEKALMRGIDNMKIPGIDK